jgi:hypothetical protein
MTKQEQASLKPVETRLDWARKYAKELEEAANAFFSDGHDGTAIDYKHDDDAGRIHVTVHLPHGFPEDLGRVIGGAFHQLRAALDNLAYQLVLTNGNRPTRRTAFPVLSACAKGEFPARTKQRLDGMSDGAQTIIERLQPYNEWPERPKDTVLWLIDELNNIDKHRIAHLACLWIATCNGSLHFQSGAAEHLQARIEEVHPRGIAEHGATLLDFRWNPMLRWLLPNPEMMMEIDISSDVALRNPEREWFLDPDRIPTRALPVTHFLNAALTYCDTTVLPAFAEEFK